MNVFKSILTVALFSLLSFPMLAQGPAGPGDRGPRGPQPEQLQEALDLSDEQMEALKPIFEETRIQMRDLRGQEFESREAQREAARAIMETQREKMADILTEAQLDKLEEMRPERGPKAGPRKPGMRLRRGKAQENEALHQALKNHHQTQVVPVLQKQRAQLEADLSAEDKLTIAALREKRAAHRTMMQQTKDQGERPAPPTEAQKEEHRSNRATVKALVEKYDTQIEALLAEVRAEEEQWKAEIKAIHEEYRPEDAPERAARSQKDREASAAKRQAKGKAMRKANFLLMDPAGQGLNRQLEESPFELEAYPNPARDLATISYTVEQAGQVTITLRNKAGNLNRVLFEGYQEAGEHTLEINTSGLQAGNYFYTISDASRRQPLTKQLVITQ